MLLAQCSKIGLAVVDRVPVGQGRVAVGDHCAAFVGSKQDAGLLVALADRGDRVTDVTLAVGGIDLAAGKDVHATGKCGRLGAPQHEDLDAFGGVDIAQQHHRCSRFGNHRKIGHYGRR